MTMLDHLSQIIYGKNYCDTALLIMISYCSSALYSSIISALENELLYIYTSSRLIGYYQYFCLVMASYCISTIYIEFNTVAFRRTIHLLTYIMSTTLCNVFQYLGSLCLMNTNCKRIDYCI